jgi:hypothetical protein
MFRHANCKYAGVNYRLAVLLSALLATAAAHADTENVRKGLSQLEFRPAAGASGGATRSQLHSERQGMFRHIDFDGDGFVSKAEAAGFATATLGFDRADRNRDGKLSFAEYDSIFAPPRPAKKRMVRAKKKN